MFERFTDRARRVVVLAQEEARMLGHNYIGTEHVLLGLLREQNTTSTLVLGFMGVDPADLRKRVIEMLGAAIVERAPIPVAPIHTPISVRREDVEKALAWINAYRLINIPDPFWQDHYLRPLWEALNQTVVNPEE